MRKWELSGFEVSGRSIRAVGDGLQSFTGLSADILLSEGLGRLGPDSRFVADPDAWYPMEGNVRASFRLAREVGAGVLFQIGTRLPDHAEFPPLTTDADLLTALQAVNVAYHLNHRRDGQVLYDASTQRTLDGGVPGGIGSYLSERVKGEPEILVRCENPYPCDLDRGIITGMARRFSKVAVVLHDATTPCRKRGDDLCLYRVRWT